MQRVFTTIYHYFEKNRTALFALFLSTLAVFVYFATKVSFVEDVYAIIPKDKKTEKLSEVFQNSKFADKTAIMVSLKDTAAAQPDSLVQYADALAEKLAGSAKPYIKALRSRVEDDFTMQLMETIQQHLPVFLTKTDYLKIDTLLQPEKLKETLQNDIKLLGSPAGFAVKNIIANDPSGISFLALKKLQQLQYEDNFELYDSHILTKDHKTLMMFITPAFAAGNTGKNKLLFNAIDTSMSSLQSNGFGHIRAQYFGGAVVSQGNAAQLRRDTLLTQLVTVLFLVFFIGYYFRKKRAPLLILVPVLYGAAFSLAAIYFIRGSISVIALGMGSIVLGIAVSYSLHVFNHYRHTGNKLQVIKDLSFPLTIGSFTTIFGFFSLQFATSDMLKDLGLFAGFSLVGAALCSLIFLPHFLGEESKTPSWKHSLIDKIAAVRMDRKRWLIAAIFLLTVLFSFFAGRVQFEPDMTQLNYMTEDVKSAEAKLNSISGSSLKSIYLVTAGKTLDEALQQTEQVQADIENLKTTQKITSSAGVSGVLLSDSLQTKRIAFWNRYWTHWKKEKLMSDIRSQGVLAGFKADAFDNFNELLNRDYQLVQPAALHNLRQNFLDDYITEKPGNASVVTLLKVPAQHKQEAVMALENDPAVTVLDRQYLTSRLTQMVNEDFNRIAWIVSLLVAGVLLLTYGRIELMLISFVPMLISWVWILGIMAIAGIHFNIVNIIISALIFGLGDDYSLFVMDGLLNEYKTGKKNLASYKSAIFLSAITTIAGLGVLIFAKHPALKSIAFISVTGIVCVVLMSQVLIPFFFNLVIKNRIAKNFHPWTILSWLHSVASFLYFGFASFLLTIIGFFVVKLHIFGRERGKKMYHYLLSKLCASVLYLMGRFKKNIINPLHENFEKPAVVIANHQSFLDILMMGMLNPRLILLTNKWVWNSPVFGWAIKMADFYPVANGIENSVDLLKTQVDKGYSIVVFPEGTRSSHPPMKRFHKGAFYLAEKLSLDIVPVLLHGLGYTMTKGEFLLKNGDVTAHYLPRIEATDQQWGTNYQARSKSVSKYFKQQHEQLRSRMEPPRYFGEHLFFNYIYKGPVLEWYLKIKLRLENYYQLFHELLPREGKILDLGCGYGFMCYMLHWASQQKRMITGVDYDEEKIATASHCFSKTDALRFEQADITQFQPKTCDGITIMDVLHYLQPGQQEAVIEKAVAALNPGGVLIIRDGDARLKHKHRGTRFSEWLSTKIFSFNKKVNDLQYISGNLIESIAAKHDLKLQTINQAKYTSNIVWVLKKTQLHV